MGKKIAIATLLLVLTQYQVFRYTLSTLSAQSDGRVHVAHVNSQGGGVG